MHFLCSLVIVLVGSLVFAKLIKKYAPAFYLLSLISAGMAIMYRLFWRDVENPLMFPLEDLEKSIYIGAFGTAIFVVVMFIGALNTKYMLVKRLMSIRAELGIIACIMIIPHNIPNLIMLTRVIPRFRPEDTIAVVFIILGIISIVAIFLMLPLWITSFKTVRKNMQAKAWKKLQKLSYIFYFLIYVEVVVVFLFYAREPKYFELAIYTAVFGIYTILRIKKHMSSKKIKSN